MAKQVGIMPLEGTIGNITFYKSKAGYLAKQKTSISADRIATDPAFIRTRENGTEFGRAGKAGKLLRTAFRELLLNAGDSYVASRLTSEMVKVLRADATNKRGQRNVIDGEAELLQGFEFNVNGRLGGTFYAPYAAVIDRAAGKTSVTIPPFVPINMVAAPFGASHFRIMVSGAEVDFEANTFVNGSAMSGQLALDTTLTEALNLSVDVPANSTKPLFLALGIEFYQEVNAELYGLKNGSFNALALVMVSGVPDAAPPPAPPGP